MNLFIETPEQVSARMARNRRCESDPWLKAVQDEYAAERSSSRCGMGQSDAADDPLASWGAPDWSEFQRQMQDDRPWFDPRRLMGKGSAKRRARQREVEAQGDAAAMKRPQADSSYSVAQESYREELAFDKKRGRRRRLLAVMRAFALIIMIPVLLCAIFIGSYVLTCILNGASPEEVVELLGTMVSRIEEFVLAL